MLEWSRLAPALSPLLDWEDLQLGGMICAALLCIAGILFALSELWGWRDGAEGGHVRRGVAQGLQALCIDVSSSHRWQVQMQAQ